MSSSDSADWSVWVVTTLDIEGHTTRRTIAIIPKISTHPFLNLVLLSQLWTALASTRVIIAVFGPQVAIATPTLPTCTRNAQRPVVSAKVHKTLRALQPHPSLAPSTRAFIAV